MRTFILALTAADLFIGEPANSQQAPTRVRDCLRNSEFGLPAPVSSRPNGKWLYIASVMKSKDGTEMYGSAVSWKVAGSLEQACDAAIAEFRSSPENSGWTITGALVQLVPDSVVRLAVH